MIGMETGGGGEGRGGGREGVREKGGGGRGGFRLRQIECIVLQKTFNVNVDMLTHSLSLTLNSLSLTLVTLLPFFSPAACFVSAVEAGHSGVICS